jgi:hypothetical protein
LPAAVPQAPEPAPATATGLRAATAALGLLILALTITPITNNDLFLHLETGQQILSTGHVPVVDDYSALARGRTFTAHEWLSGVVFYLVQHGFGARGFDALILFKAGVACLLAFVLYRAAVALGADRVVAIGCLALVMILAAARFLERPHIFSYLFLALVLLVLARRRRGLAAGRRWEGFLVLPVLQVLWANLHGGFLLGPATVFLAAAGELFDGVLASSAGRAAWADHRREAARLTGLAGLLVAASLVNPYGVALLEFPFALTGSAFMDLIYEWLPPYDAAFRRTYMARYYVVWAAFGALVLATALKRSRGRGAGRPPFFQYLLFAFLFALSLRMNRNVTDFALATMPGVGAAASGVLASTRGRPGARRLALPAVAAILCGLALYFALAGYPFSPSTRRPFGLGLGPKIPVAAVDYLERNGIRGASFNTYGAGAYLVFRLYPQVRVGMDSRNDVYGEELYAEYRRALLDAEALRRMTRRLGAAFVLFEWPQQGMSTIAKTFQDAGDGWRIVYFDDAAAVYLQDDGPYAGIARRDGYRLLDPALFRPGEWAEEERGAALVEAQRAVAQSGGSYIARVMLVEALLSLGREREAAAEESRIVQEDPPLPHIAILLGLAHLGRGDRITAAARFRRALELNPLSDAARDALRQATEGS